MECNKIIVNFARNLKLEFDLKIDNCAHLTYHNMQLLGYIIIIRIIITILESSADSQKFAIFSWQSLK